MMNKDGAYKKPHYIQGKSQTLNTFLGEKGNTPSAQKKHCQNEQFFSHLLNPPYDDNNSSLIHVNLYSNIHAKIIKNEKNTKNYIRNPKFEI
jgi:hypothetical protein